MDNTSRAETTFPCVLHVASHHVTYFISIRNKDRDSIIGPRQTDLLNNNHKTSIKILLIFAWGDAFIDYKGIAFFPWRSKNRPLDNISVYSMRLCMYLIFETYRATYQRLDISLFFQKIWLFYTQLYFFSENCPIMQI